ncbi:MAG: IS4 family transposase [Prochloraceae cyanobacterium]
MFPQCVIKQFEKYLSESQIQTLKILIWLLQVHKQVRIERLAACLPLPILYESRRKHLQRFLVLPNFSIVLFWFPIIKSIVEKEFKSYQELILAIDRTNWKNNNVLMLSLIWKNRSLPLYWQILEKDEGCSNLAEQKSVIRPILKLLKKYTLILIGDREFHGVELANWLEKEYISKRKQEVFFAFRQKQDTYIKQQTEKEYQQLFDLGMKPGKKIFLSELKVTKGKGFGNFNLAAYWKRKYKRNNEEEPWYLLTNLDNLEKVLKVYSTRYGIEALFKDCKTGGYNLEGSKANKKRLTNLILLIALSYTMLALRGKNLKNKGLQKYIARLKENKRTTRRHSDHWVGMYGEMWILAWNFCYEWIDTIIKHNSGKAPFYQKGLRAMSAISLN